jgi:hypothetical protein
MLEFSRPSAGYTAPLPAADLAYMRTAPEYSSLADYWGQAAPTMLGRVCDSFNRIVAALDQNGRDEFLDWFSSQTPHERQLLAWAIAEVG